jgi:acetyl esterase/lipase
VGEAEAFSMLDSARAALRLSGSVPGLGVPVANVIVLEGHSQGGHAALFAHQAWERYAPDLNVLGTVAFAPGSELRLMAQRMAKSWSSLLGMGVSAMYAYSDYYGAPDVLDSWLREPYATELPDRIEDYCTVRIGLWLGFRPDKVLQPDLLAAVREGRWEDTQPWMDYLDANTPGDYSSLAPVIVIQGENDQLIPPEASEQLMERLCTHGTPVQLSRYVDADHLNITRVGFSEASQWIAGRLAGVPAPNGCP